MTEPTIAKLRKQNEIAKVVLTKCTLTGFWEHSHGALKTAVQNAIEEMDSVV